MRDADAEAKQPPFDGENLTYTLWSFGELNVLVRYRADGYIPEAGSDGKILVSIHTKKKKKKMITPLQSLVFIYLFF